MIAYCLDCGSKHSPDDCPSNFRKSHGRRVGHDNRRANTLPNVERTASDEPLQTSHPTPFDSQVRIRIDTFRTKLGDADGISAKAILDGLVYCGVLRGDSLKEISEPVEIYQHKVKNRSEEKTEIRLKKVK